MNILHTSDWHLGIALHKHSLIEDQRFFIEQLRAIIIEEHIDVVLISGDIYDTTLASKEAIALFDQAMRMFCLELKKEVIVIAGNHDSHTRLSVCSELLKPVGLHIYGSIEEGLTPLSIQDVDFFSIPYYHKESVALHYECKFKSYEEAMARMINDVVNQRTSRKQVVLAHCFVSGASVCESDRFAMVGGSDLISKDVFQGIDYVALGHLHSGQSFGNHVHYCGSPIAYSFSETKAKKVMIWNSETGAIKDRVVSAFRPICTIEGTYDEVLEKIPSKCDAYLKIILKDQAVSYELLSFFRERAPYLLALSGTTSKQLVESATLDVQDIEAMGDEEIVGQFFRDYFDREIREEELRWLQEAKEKVIACD